jgi:hypothetical protein
MEIKRGRIKTTKNEEKRAKMDRNRAEMGRKENRELEKSEQIKIQNEQRRV